VNRDIVIKALVTELELYETIEIIRNSFKTVAVEMGFTPENAPTNPAFISSNQVQQLIDKGVKLFGLFIEGKQAGCMGLEKADEEIYYLEKLAVVPELRHRGLGKKLLDFAFEYVKQVGGKKISIAIVNENRKLKDWYERYGFCETGLKRFSHLPFTVCFMEKSVAE
jgi:ribosomal protein S18 acetylase RimI-like enzyme